MRLLFSDNDHHIASLVSGLSPEMAAMLLACVIGGYTLIGGLGATFYVSYFNTALIFVLILMLVIEVTYIEKIKILLVALQCFKDFFLSLRSQNSIKCKGF